MNASTVKNLPGGISGQTQFPQPNPLKTAHLLAARALTEGARLWTRDKRLDTLAHELELGYVLAVR